MQITSLTAVTLGLLIHPSTSSGPTLCTMTIVLAFTAATALTMLSPLFHAEMLLL